MTTLYVFNIQHLNIIVSILVFLFFYFKKKCFALFNRLKEIGPRLNLSLVKIEEGFEGGNVMFHAHVQKTPEELEALKKMRQSKQ